MSFANPSVLIWLALVPLIALFFFWSWRKKESDLQAFAGTTFQTALSAERSKARQRTKDLLRLISLALLLIAAARPQWGEKWEEAKRRGMDLMVAVDVSKSMLAGDVSPSRLERARRKVADLAAILEGDRLGLIAFAGQAFVLMPPTLDYGALPLFLDALSPESVSRPGTAVSEAIALAVRSFENEGSPESRSVILMSDGEDLAGDAAQAVETAEEKGIQINTLGIGTPEGAPIPEAGGGFKKDASGNLVHTRLDESALRRIAEKTGGAYVRSVAGDGDLKLIYRTIRGGREEQELKGGKERRMIDRYPWFLGLAVLLLAIEILLKETKSKKGASRAIAAVFLLAVMAPRSLPAFGTIGTIREGEKLYEAGRYEEALQKFLEAEKKKPPLSKDPRLQYNLGNAYHQLKRYDEAAKAFSKSSGLKTLYNQGNNQYRQGALEEAIASYEEALKLDPNDEDARFNLEFVKKQLEKKKQEEKSPESQPSQNSQDSQDSQEKNQEQKDGQQQQTAEPEKQEPQKGKEGQEKQESAQGGNQQEGAMSREEAERWLSGLSEGRPRVYSGDKGKKNGEKRRIEKDW